MSFFCWLSRKHYWSIPHRTADKHLVQVCYECGAERPARELHNEMAAEWLRHSMATAKLEVPKLRAVPPTERTSPTEIRVRPAAGQAGSRKLVAVK